MRPINYFFLLQFITILALPFSYANTVDKAYLEALALSFLKEKIPPPADGKIAIEVSSIDPRIIIKPCQEALKTNIPEKNVGRNVNVKITCADSIPWVMYLPAKVERTFAVIVANKTIAKGTILSVDNIGIKYLANNRIRGDKLTELSTVLGSKAKQRIGKGRAINGRSVCLVCKGDVVTIIAKSLHFTIKTQGIALNSANIHQQVKVKNKRSGNVITPTVTAMNQVTINL